MESLNAYVMSFFEFLLSINVSLRSAGVFVPSLQTLRVFACLCVSLRVFVCLCVPLRSLGVFVVFR